MYDISILGSTYFQVPSYALAHETARGLSLEKSGRLVRIHDIDGESVLAEYRFGRLEATYKPGSVRA